MVLNSNKEFVFIHQPAQKIHFQNICKISDAQLGKGYLSDFLLQKKLENKNVIFNVVLYNSEVVGFYILYLQTSEQNFFHDLNLSITNFTESGLIIKTIAISRQFQNKGITTDILYQIEEISKNKSLKKTYCLAWQHQSTLDIPMSKILIKNGFYQTQTIQNYWREDSILRNFECPICGKPPCLCSLSIFEKNC